MMSVGLVTAVLKQHLFYKCVTYYNF